MSLLQSLPYKDYQKALAFTRDQCEVIAKILDLRNLSLDGPKTPGETLMKTLDRRGFSAQQYKKIIDTAFVPRNLTYYQPQAKIAILIGNQDYIHYPKLATPSIDCDMLSDKLKGLGFAVVTFKNLCSNILKKVLQRLFAVIPEDSYCFIFYAGHGCELINIKCMLGVDCPMVNMQSDHFVTENFLLKEAAKCKPDLCMFLMDMCRINLDRKTISGSHCCLNYYVEYAGGVEFVLCMTESSLQTHQTESSLIPSSRQLAFKEKEKEFPPKVHLEYSDQVPKLEASNVLLFNQLVDTEEHSIHKNLLVGYSTLSAHSAYEVLEIECSQTIDCNITYELKSQDQVLEGASQYTHALCSHLDDNVDVSRLLDRVHEDVENAPKKQRPIKVQCGVAKRSLHDPAVGDVKALLKSLEDVGKEINKSYIVS